MGRPKGSKNYKIEKTDSLEAFAKRIEQQVLQANLKGQESMERLVCRILVNSKKNPAVAAALAARWVEWRYGKATETHKHQVEVQMTVSDADRIITEHFSSAGQRTLEIGQGDSSQAPEQTLDVLPS